MIKRLMVAGLALAVLVAAGVWWLWREPDRDGALALYGNVEIRDVRLGFRVPGRLAELTVHEGDPVAADQLLARLDDEPYRQALQAAQARVDAARARLELLRTGSRPQEVQRARAAVREAQAAAADARIELERQRSLQERGATSQQALDAAAARAEQAQARLDAARETLELAREGFRAEEIQAAEAELALARADAEQARTRVEDTRLTAPVAGTVLTRVHEPGAVVAQGEPVYTLSLDQPVWVRAYVDEPDLGRVRPGMTAWVYSDSRQTPYRGQVGFISPQAEFTPKQVQTERLRTDLVYRLRVVVTEADQGLRQGMPVTVVLDQAAGGEAAPAP